MVQVARRSSSRHAWRRVAILYSGGELFACRHCYRLAYESQNETPYLHSIRRVRKIRMRLGAGFSFAEPFPDKPPAMHWRTYLHMRATADEWVSRSFARGMKSIRGRSRNW